MMNDIFKITLIVLISVFVSFFGIGVINLSGIYSNQITVTGMAKKEFENKLAEYTITFTTQDKDKSFAENKNNEKVKKFLEEVRNFGISETDITTDSLNVYQQQEQVKQPGTEIYAYKPTDWVYSQTIRVKLKDISKVNEFTNLASRNESSTIYGPNFAVDTQSIDENQVYDLAFENAKTKAESIANKSGRRLGKSLYITEGFSNTPYPLFARSLMGGGGASSSAEIPSGSSEVSKTLTVVFELK